MLDEGVCYLLGLQRSGGVLITAGRVFRGAQQRRLAHMRVKRRWDGEVLGGPI